MSQNYIKNLSFPNASNEKSFLRMKDTAFFEIDKILKQKTPPPSNKWGKAEYNQI
jgi:hypothetical protein